MQAHIPSRLRKIVVENRPQLPELQARSGETFRDPRETRQLGGEPPRLHKVKEAKTSC